MTFTPESVTLDDLLELHAQTSKGPWEIYPDVHQETKIVQQGRGAFGLIADVSTAPEDYGRANTRFIVAAHALVPALAEELVEARKLLAGAGIVGTRG
jgi:hypothetical protein